MTTWVDMEKRIERLDVDFEAGEAVEETKAVIKDLQLEQWREGVLSDGEEIKPPYTPNTVAIKKRKGQPTNRVTLKDTGARDRATGVRVDGDLIRIGSDVEYDAHLEDKYTKKIWGLMDESRQQYIDDNLRPAYIARVREKIRL